MKTFLVFFALIFFPFSICAFAQADGKSQTKEQNELKAKAFDLLAEILSENAALKLPENRSLISSRAADLFWEKDEKLARKLFQNAANELVQAQNAPLYRGLTESTYNQEIFRTIITNNMRGQLAVSISRRDSKLALEILLMTRPAELEAAVQTYRQIKAQTGKAPDLSDLKWDERQKFSSAVNEINLEQQIEKEAIKNDPAKLAEKIRADFADETVNGDIFADLNALNKKDHELAQKTLSEITAKLAGADFSRYSNWFTAYWIYQKFFSDKNKSPNQNPTDKNKQLELDEQTVKKIANREFDYLLTKEVNVNDYNLIERIFNLKKILPERFGEIKSKYERIKQASNEWTEDAETTETLGENPPLEKIIENSNNLSSSSRENYYRQAVNKILETETEEKAAQMLDKIPSEKDRQTALDYLDSVSAEKKATRADALEAKRAVLQIKSGKERLAKLINLAIVFNQKNTETDRKIAEDLLNEASNLVNFKPETAGEYDDVLKIIAGYAAFNPSRAFDLTAPVVSDSNDLIDAYVRLSSYYDDNYPHVREGEILFGGENGYYNLKARYAKFAKNLAASDFEKARKLIENFRRADVRLLAKMILAESILEK